ncbi:hypothetical protein TNCV_4119831 [Trichonephila clavipes]|nr:hypothetical protein TNCV_4119831 [Trichonephila clavipes]
MMGVNLMHFQKYARPHLISGYGSLVVKVTNSWMRPVMRLNLVPLKMHRAEYMSRLKRLSFGMGWKLEEGGASSGVVIVISPFWTFTRSYGQKPQSRNGKPVARVPSMVCDRIFWARQRSKWFTFSFEITKFTMNYYETRVIGHGWWEHSRLLLSCLSYVMGYN